MKFLPTIGSALSGKLGGIVASHNKGGTYFRRLSVPSGGVPTAQQEVIRNAVRDLSATWQTLSQAQRDAWATYAVNVLGIDAIGQSIQLSGFNWFIGTNTIRAQSGQALVLDAPTTFDRGGVDLSAAEYSALGTAGTLDLGTSPGSLGLSAGDMILVYQGRDFSPGRFKYFGSFQFVRSILGDDTNSTFTMTLPFSHASENSQTVTLNVTRGDGRYSTPAQNTVLP